MKCCDCEAPVDETVQVCLQTGCYRPGIPVHSTVFPCVTCGRLHFGDGSGVETRSNPPEPVVLEDGKIKKRLADGSLVEIPSAA